MAQEAEQSSASREIGGSVPRSVLGPDTKPHVGGNEKQCKVISVSVQVEKRYISVDHLPFNFGIDLLIMFNFSVTFIKVRGQPFKNVITYTHLHSFT